MGDDVCSPIVLGICSFTHDSAAALIVDGKLVGFVEEERLDGIKHTKAFPGNAVVWLLNQAGLTVQDIDAVAYNFEGEHYLNALAQTQTWRADPRTRGLAQARADSFVKVHGRYLKRIRELADRFPKAAVVPTLHHRAHGLYAFASSGYEEAAVLVVDSLGEVQSTSIGHGRRTDPGCRYDIVEAIEDPASLGYAYGAVTEHLGWRRGDEEGTVMALAALGDPRRFRDLFARAITLTEHGFALDPTLLPLRVLSSGHSRISAAFTEATCPARQGGEPIEAIHADVAAALQERTEQVMVHLARRVRDVTGSRLLCLGGGVAANCVAVGKIVQTGIFDEVHVPPAPGDSGTAIGAATSVYLQEAGRLPVGVTGRCYLGPDFAGYVPPGQPPPGWSVTRPEQPAQLLAERLAAGDIVGLFHGPLEAGPRALGNRSILASPMLPDVVARLNATVKYREPFRPFAPVVLAEAAGDYFTLPQPSPYMSIASGVTALTWEQIPAVVHVNDTARVQTLTRDQNPFLADVLCAFAAITGVPVLINTSLNIKGKPICGTPQMALDCLLHSGMDALLIEGWWVST